MPRVSRSCDKGGAHVDVQVPFHLACYWMHGLGVWMFMMPSYLYGGANATATMLLQTIVEAYNLLPRGTKVETLYIQCDNTSKENKNTVMFQFCSVLVLMKIVKQVKFSCQPVGHTKNEVDQIFSQVWRFIRQAGASSVTDFNTKLKKEVHRNAAKWHDPVHTVILEVMTTCSCAEEYQLYKTPGQDPLWLHRLCGEPLLSLQTTGRWCEVSDPA